MKSGVYIITMYTGLYMMKGRLYCSPLVGSIVAYRMIANEICICIAFVLQLQLDRVVYIIQYRGSGGERFNH